MKTNKLAKIVCSVSPGFKKTHTSYMAVAPPIYIWWFCRPHLRVLIAHLGTYGVATLFVHFI